MITVRGRVLPAGSVQYKNQNRPTVLQTSAASWDIRGKAFFDAKRLVNWTFIKFADIEIKRQEVEGFRGILRNSGVNSGEPTPPDGVPAFLEGGRANEDRDDKKIESTLAEAAKRGLKVLLVLLPDKSAYIYSRIKFWAEVKFGSLCWFLYTCSMLTRDRDPNHLLRCRKIQGEGASVLG